MRTWLISGLALGLLTFGVTASVVGQEDSRAEGYVHVVKVNGIISDATHQLIESAREEAERKNATALIIELDTPGGFVASTREIVKEELNAKVPVVVYVGPKGARAGSAGVFITLAGHVAAMAPGTNIGAAHPIGIGTPDFLPKEEDEKGDKKDSDRNDKEEKEDDDFIFRSDQEHLARKLENDTVAWAEAIAKERGRNVEWARDAVLNSVSITSDEALELNVIDLIANDREALLEALDGRVVETEAGAVTIRSKGADVFEHTMSSKQRFLSFLSHPTILGMLMLLMMVGFAIEIYHPGLIVPAVVGGLALITLLVGSSLVSLNILGAILILGGMVMLILEFKIVSYGMLTVGGVGAIVAGFYLLVDKVDYSAPAVDWTLLAPVLIVVVGIVAFLTYFAARAQMSSHAADLSDMVGQVGDATTDIDPEGKVFILGTYWTAESSQKVGKGERVRIVAVEGLKLRVEPVSSGRAATAAVSPSPDGESAA